jgi:tetratricopeptide (TPR) repeat protein
MRRGYLVAGLSVVLLIFVMGGCASKEKQAEGHFKKGFDYQNQGDLDKALEEYNKALELNPNYVQVYTNLGTVYLGKEDYDRAIQHFKKSLELNYLDKKAHYNIGVAYLYKGEAEKAEEHLKFLKNIRSEMGDVLERKIAESKLSP